MQKKIVVVILIVLLCPLLVFAGNDAGGWEQGGNYDSLYQAAELDRLKGEILKIEEVIPFKGMKPGIALQLKDGDGEKVLVHVGPKWFLGNNIGLKRGDRVKIKGAWAEIGGKDIFLASKIKKGDYFSLKVRLTKDGTPFWSMPPEQLEKERAAE